MEDYYIAQINIANMLASKEDPVMMDFVNNLERINAIADNAPGFVWRLKGEEENAQATNVFEDNYLLINMSVWTDMKSLFDYVYNSDHIEIMRRKKEWFHKMKDMHMVFWYVKQGHIPSAEEAKQRLAYVREHGESPYAFTFKSKFSVEDFLNFKVADS